jgi:small nuclear ribonucleoprotein (snRNP)-like protein
VVPITLNPIPFTPFTNRIASSVPRCSPALRFSGLPGLYGICLNLILAICGPENGGMRVTFIEEMQNLVGKEIVVIMVDGRGYRGVLDSADKDIAVLSGVYETQNQEVDERGYMFWRKVLHARVFVRLPMVMRVWPWDVEGIKTVKAKKT